MDHKYIHMYARHKRITDVHVLGQDLASGQLTNYEHSHNYMKMRYSQRPSPRFPSPPLTFFKTAYQSFGKSDRRIPSTLSGPPFY